MSRASKLLCEMGDNMQDGWHGFDLDGTLAIYNGYKGADHIGEPVPDMINRVKNFLNNGENVRILTARVHPMEGDDAEIARKAIQDWCKQHIGVVLPVTHEKDSKMIDLYDDRAFRVEKNTGRVIGE